MNLHTNKESDEFESEKTCVYRGETYRVRDNGYIYRCKNPDKRKSKYDEKWIKGRTNKNNYLVIGKESVHRIIATAFHGEQPSKKHVVDHIDTNRKNNRPENLRWVTRLENILLNPITCSRIINIYGSIDNFLENPSKPINGQLEKNYGWMRTVTKEESINTRKNLINWAKEGKTPTGGQLGEWIFSKIGRQKGKSFVENQLTESQTPMALQKNWKTQSEFPNCPTSLTEKPIISYKEKLVKGSTFSRNKYGESIIEKSEIGASQNELYVITNNKKNVKPYGVSRVFIENNKLVHENLGSFFKYDGANKKYTIAIGREWKGGQTFDDLV